MGMGMGTREVKTICLREVQAALFARWQMGGLVGATPLIWTSSVSPTNVNYGGLGRVAGGQICYWRSVCPSTIAFLQRAGQRGNESGRQLPSTLMMGSYASKFQIIETLIDLLPLQSSLCLMMMGSFGL